MNDLSHFFLWFVLINPVSPEAQQLIDNLNNPNYQQREIATQKLKKMGWQAIPTLEYNINKSDLETQKRCKSVIDTYYYMKDIPWIFNQDSTDVNTFYNIQPSTVAHRYLLETNFNFVQATWEMRRDLLRLGIPPSFLDAYINKAREREKEYREKYNVGKDVLW